MELSPYWQKIAAKTRAEHRPFLSLAPMEAVTNAVFRQVVDSAAAPDVINTEFVNALSITHPKAKFAAQGRLYISENEPIKPIVQLWGAMLAKISVKRRLPLRKRALKPLISTPVVQTPPLLKITVGVT